MKQMFPQKTIAYRSSLFGMTARAYHKRLKAQQRSEGKRGEILEFTRKVRQRQPKLGTKKLQLLLEKKASLKIGRDALSDILRSENLLIRNVKKYRPKCTDGNGNSIYPDLRKGIKVERINQLWSSDITYIDLQGRKFCYLVLIVDEYSHLIVGYHLARDMKTEQVITALQMAITEQSQGKETFNKKLIIHSDRGSQYKSKDFKEQAFKYEILTSMCAKGKSHENPVAERLNGILKYELGMKSVFKNVGKAKEAVRTAIEIYNEERPHMSCEMLTPQEAHIKGKGVLKKLWRQRKNYKSVSKD